MIPALMLRFFSTAPEVERGQRGRYIRPYAESKSQTPLTKRLYSSLQPPKLYSSPSLELVALR